MMYVKPGQYPGWDLEYFDNMAEALFNFMVNTADCRDQEVIEYGDIAFTGEQLHCASIGAFAFAGLVAAYLSGDEAVVNSGLPSDAIEWLLKSFTGMYSDVLDGTVKQYIIDEEDE